MLRLTCCRASIDSLAWPGRRFLVSGGSELTQTQGLNEPDPEAEYHLSPYKLPSLRVGERRRPGHWLPSPGLLRKVYVSQTAHPHYPHASVID